jgi:glucose-fructose oxidoreductase
MKSPKTEPLRIVGINFDHMHMGDLLRMAHDHPEAEIVGICDETPERMQAAIQNFNIPPNHVHTDVETCLESTCPDLVILCPATGLHAEYVERVAPYGAAILVEKPFADSVANADRMIAAAKTCRITLAINWPLRWVPSHCTAHRLVQEGAIGKLQEVHYYDGNRGPLYHTADKIETHPTPADKRKSWFYQRDLGGGSLQDYLGYGTTLGTWFHNGRKPTEITTVTDESGSLEVDEHSITIARYSAGLSKFETRWGTFTDPWTHQPQPKCGFILKGSAGTIASYDYEPTIRIQNQQHPEGHDLPVDPISPPLQNPIQYMIHCLRNNLKPEGPLSPKISRIGQQIVDSAALSAQTRKSVKLVP